MYETTLTSKDIQALLM